MIDTDLQTEQFSQLCDAVERIFYANKDGIESYENLTQDVGFRHTSSDARKAAMAVFEVLGIE